MIRYRAEYSALVGVGTFSGYGVPYWDTPSGGRPTLQEFKDGKAQIRTPVYMNVSQTLLGSAGVAQASSILGGMIGCDVFNSSPNPSIDLGQDYLIFVALIPDNRGTTVGQLLDAWPLTEDGKVVTPLEGQLTLDEVERVIAGEFTLPTYAPEGPGEPPPDYPETAPDPAASGFDVT